MLCGFRDEQYRHLNVKSCFPSLFYNLKITYGCLSDHSSFSGVLWWDLRRERERWVIASFKHFCLEHGYWRCCRFSDENGRINIPSRFPMIFADSNFGNEHHQTDALILSIPRRSEYARAQTFLVFNILWVWIVYTIRKALE